MKKTIFKGAGTALITPMKDGEIDYAALAALIEMQIDGEIDAVIISGTTGEAATLKAAEREKLFAFSAERVNKRTKLIFGIGSNDTEEVLSRVKLANKYSPDGLLAVTPYYNKGTRRGILEHYKKVANESHSPIILYNVPSRTGVSLSAEDVKILSAEENIVAIKEAEDSAKKLSMLAAMGEEIGLYAGCDTQIYTCLSLGGLGVISVISNIIPKRVCRLCREFFSGKAELAREEQFRLLPFINSMFLECNPAPIKYAMSLCSLCENQLRLPLSPVGEKTEREIERQLSLLNTERLK